MSRRMLARVAVAAIWLATSTAHAATCDRACLQGLADRLLDGIVRHDVASLPLASTYAATENSAPAAVNMMVLWRTATAIRGRYYAIDPTTQQLFVIATLGEGQQDSLLFGRMKAVDGKLAEVELYTSRSRGQSGFMFSPDALANLPPAWTVQIAPQQRASRAVLSQAARSIFDTRVQAPDIAGGCVLMENGRVVAENPDVAKSVAPADGAPGAPAANADGTVPIPCGNPPIRPTDRKARTSLIDEEQGVVVSLAVVDGVVEPYLVTEPTESAFVPNSMLAPYTDMLKKQQASGKFRSPALRSMPASQVVAELHRVYDGKLQGMMMLQITAGTGSRSPWVER